jgi:peptide/nickel transport system substrate-binding protein
MFNITRRQAFAASGGLVATLLAPRRFAIAAAGNTLNIAYNLPLPSFDPDVGPSSVNPTIQAMYRSIFDQYVGRSLILPLSLVCSRPGAGMMTRAKSGWM